jgi:putative ABC transport system ATP-binding protein
MTNNIQNPKVILRACNVNKIYTNGSVSTHAVKDVNFEVREGEFIVVLGPSGSGKSTLLNLIGGMDAVTSGQLYYRDQGIHELKKKELARYRRKVVGFVFQFYNLLPSLNCIENVRLTADLADNPLPVKEIIKRVGLEGREYHFPSQLSGGQQQRIALARAIVKSPEILLCDEPTGALDTESGEQVLDLLRQINREFNKTIIIISHDPNLLRFADRFFEIRDGQLQERVIEDAL